MAVDETNKDLTTAYDVDGTDDTKLNIRAYVTNGLDVIATDDIRVKTFTGSAAMSSSFTFTDKIKVESVKLHTSAAPTTSGNLTITLNAGAGPEYDTLLYENDLAADSKQDWNVLIENEIFVSGDALDFSYANADSVTWGLSVYYRSNTAM
jgi:hypothetical protein